MILLQKSKGKEENWKLFHNRHYRESENLEPSIIYWIPAFAGMTKNSCNLYNLWLQFSVFSVPSVAIINKVYSVAKYA